MTIKEVGEKYGISGDTLRYYERVGMIPPVPRTAGGIRDYGEEDLRWVELVVCMRSAGLPIGCSKWAIPLFRRGCSCCRNSAKRCWSKRSRSSARWIG